MYRRSTLSRPIEPYHVMYSTLPDRSTRFLPWGCWVHGDVSLAYSWPASFGLSKSTPADARGSSRHWLAMQRDLGAWIGVNTY